MALARPGDPCNHNDRLPAAARPAGVCRTARRPRRTGSIAHPARPHSAAFIRKPRSIMSAGRTG